MLSPIDIHNKEFTRGIRGYNVDEVNDFLDKVMKDYELTIRKNKELEKQMKDLEERVANYVSIEDTLNKSIVVAQETAEELKSNAKKEAKLIIKEAEKNADRIINESFSESRKITMETEELKRQSKVYRTRLKMIIEAQLDMVNNEEWDQFLESGEESQKEAEAVSEQ